MVVVHFDDPEVRPTEDALRRHTETAVETIDEVAKLLTNSTWFRSEFKTGGFRDPEAILSASLLQGKCGKRVEN